VAGPAELMTGEDNRPVPYARRYPLRHGLGFLVSGGVAFIVDALLLWLLTSLAGLHPIPARLVAIACAMVAGWLMHRTLTFAVRLPPSVPEFLRYAGVQWTVAAVNYALFVIVVLARPEIAPLLALVVATVVSVIISYLGLRFGVFREPG
jgi:putative flippase GtrA